MGINEKPTETPAGFVVTQEMIDIARESIRNEADTLPERLTMVRFRRSHAIWALAMQVISLIGLGRM